MHQTGGVNRLQTGKEVRRDLLRFVKIQRTVIIEVFRSVIPSTYSIDSSSSLSASTRSKMRQTFGEMTSRAVGLHGVAVHPRHDSGRVGAEALSMRLSLEAAGRTPATPRPSLRAERLPDFVTPGEDSACPQR